jgi:AraC family transcriptional regulator
LNNPRIDTSLISPHVLFAQRYFFKPGQASGPRFCYASTIVLIEDGFGQLLMDGIVYEMSRGAFVYIPSGTRHRWESSVKQPMVHRCTYFDWFRFDRPALVYENDYFCFDEQEFRQELVSADPMSNITTFQTVPDVDPWIKRFDRFTFVAEEHNIQTLLERQGHFQLFLKQFLQLTIHPDRTPDPRIRSASDWIDECVNSGLFHLKWDVHIGELAERFGVSRGYFHALFKEEIGLSPKNYWNQKILEAAERDLKFTDLTVTNIADKYAFSSVHYFSRMFSRHKGIPPLEFRRRSRIY